MRVMVTLLRRTHLLHNTCRYGAYLEPEEVQRIIASVPRMAPPTASRAPLSYSHPPTSPAPQQPQRPYTAPQGFSVRVPSARSSQAAAAAAAAQQAAAVQQAAAAAAAQQQAAQQQQQQLRQQQRQQQYLQERARYKQLMRQLAGMAQPQVG